MVCWMNIKDMYGNMQINKLYNNNEQINIKTYLQKCGIEDIEEYLNPTGKYIENPFLYKNMIEGIQLFKYHYLQNSTVYILYDSDFDGYSSGTIMYQYMKMLNADWNIKILLHNGKERGLDDENLLERVLKEKPNLLIIPDANSNVVENTRKVFENGTDVLVLEHHDITTPIDCGVLISNQFEYENVDKNGSGCLVTHMFLRALDKEFNIEYSKWFIDMVSLSIISDSMNISSMQNREYLHYGVLYKDNIVNPFLQYLFNKFIGDYETYSQRDISFKIIPKFNACIRTNNMELKQRVCLALLNQDNIEEVANLCEQAHKNQIDIVNGVIEENIHTIEGLVNNNLIVFASDDMPRSYSGLLAGKIKTICNNKPTIVGSIKDGYMIGSLRSPIPLRSKLAENELVDFAQGHEDSCGVGIYVDNIQPLVDYYNSLEISYKPEINVLQSYSIKSIPNKLFGLFEPYNALWGYGVNKPMFHITNIVFAPSDWKIMGKTKRTLKLHKDGIDIVIFNCLKEDKENLQLGYYENDIFVYEPSKNKLKMECIGELGINEWNGKKTFQIIVDKFEISCYNKPSKDDLF